uniref:Uncharacterized protein n=1 Tax=Aquila chrysaetos chrysaetos TaxID=223781 RepID=A0A663EEV4_AQUCH
SKRRGSRPHWGKGWVKDWRCASHSGFILERSENLPLHLSFSWLQSQEPLSRNDPAIGIALMSHSCCLSK